MSAWAWKELLTFDDLMEGLHRYQRHYFGQRGSNADRGCLSLDPISAMWSCWIATKDSAEMKLSEANRDELNTFMRIYFFDRDLPPDLSARSDWFDVSCMVSGRSKLVVAASMVAEPWPGWARKRLFSFGISNGRSPKSTDVALPDVHCFCGKKIHFDASF